MKELRKIVSENVRKALTEEMGISNEVHDEALRIYGGIKQLLSNNRNIKEYEIDDMAWVTGIESKGPIKVFGGQHVLNICCQFILVENEEALNELQGMISVEFLGFIPEENTIIIRYPIMLPKGFTPDTGRITLDAYTSADLFESLEHELKHAYQFYRIKQNDPNAPMHGHKRTQIYQTASRYLRYIGFNGSAVSKMLWSVYYLDPNEITANFQSLYGSIMSNAHSAQEAIKILNESNFVEEYNFLNDFLTDLQYKNYPISDLMSFKLRMRRDADWLIRYITKGLRKMRQYLRQMERFINQKFK